MIRDKQADYNTSPQSVSNAQYRTTARCVSFIGPILDFVGLSWGRSTAKYAAISEDQVNLLASFSGKCIDESESHS